MRLSVFKRRVRPRKVAEPRRFGRTTLALLVIGSSGLSLVIGEALLRAVDYSHSPLKIEVEGQKNDWRFHHAFDDGNFEFDPQRIWRPRAGRSVFNNLGYRGKELTGERDPSLLRIMTIGDSNTLGWAGDDGPNWPEYLGELLDRRGHPNVVINAGAWGYSSYQGLRHFERMLPLQPDLVLISFGSNDAIKVYVSDADYVSELAGAARARLYSFKLGQLALATWERFTTGSDDKVNPVFRVSPEEYVANLTRIVGLSRRHGIDCVLLTRPFVGESSTESWWKNFAPQYVDATLRLGRELDVPVIDVHGYFAGKERFFEDESHFTERGHRKAAKLIADALVPLLP